MLFPLHNFLRQRSVLELGRVALRVFHMLPDHYVHQTTLVRGTGGGFHLNLAIPISGYAIGLQVLELRPRTCEAGRIRYLFKCFAPLGTALASPLSSRGLVRHTPRTRREVCLTRLPGAARGASLCQAGISGSLLLFRGSCLLLLFLDLHPLIAELEIPDNTVLAQG